MCRDDWLDSGRTHLVLLTCEHGGNEVPYDFQHLFLTAEADLASHRGWDIGALGVANRLAARLAAPLVCSTVTRLLVDLNRSADRPDTLSEYTRGLSDLARAEVLARHYHPHRQTVLRIVEAATSAGHTVVHLGIHSCTDELHGQTRELEVSLLFDEARSREAAFCRDVQIELRRLDDRIRCPFNVPYRGSDDGLTTTLRGLHDPSVYLGIEIEVRQSLITQPDQQHAWADRLADALSTVLADACPRPM